MSTEGDYRFPRRLEPGERRLVIADASRVPADYRLFDITLRDGAFHATRVLGAEICHLDRMPKPSADPVVRAREALEHVAAKGERDSVAAIARLAIDRGGHETDEILEACLPIIADVHDCADFLLVPLLWCRMAWPERIGAATRTRIDATVLGFRYWMDEPGNDVMWYFSENHALLYPYGVPPRRDASPRRYVHAVRPHRAGAGGDRAQTVARMARLISKPARWQSGTPRRISRSTSKGLCALYALSPDAGIRRALRERNQAASRDRRDVQLTTG